MRQLIVLSMLGALSACNSGGETDVERSTSASSSALPPKTTQPVTTQLAIDVDQSGHREVAASKEITGTVKLNPFVDSEFVYEVRAGNQVLLAQPLRELHEIHGIAKPGSVEEYQGSL